MVRFALVVGVVCAVGVGGTARAQFNENGGGAAMPGQAVGAYRGQVRPVGQPAPAAAPDAGQPVTGNSMLKPYDPSNPYQPLRAAGIDPSSLTAPLTGPDGKPVAAPDALDRLSDQIRAFFRSNPVPPRPQYAPGVIRRSRERGTQMWRRD